MRLQAKLFLSLMTAALPASATGRSHCAEAVDAAVINIPGYETDLGAVQPAHIKKLIRCMSQNTICLLQVRGHVISGEREAQVHVRDRTIIFAFVQHLRTASRSYCALATLLPTVGGGPEWSYRTFTPNGSWIGEELVDGSARPKSSQQVFKMLSKNFELYRRKMVELLASEGYRDGEYGYRRGELP